MGKSVKKRNFRQQHPVGFNSPSFPDPKNIMLEKQYKISKEGKNTYLLFKSLFMKSDPTYVKSEVLFHNGSPYYGCIYEYRGCEEFNYTHYHYYKAPIFAIDGNILRDKYGTKYTLLPRNTHVVSA